MRWIDALILGLVQGLTEFLPISSDGHLSIVEKALAGFSGVPSTGSSKLFFVVMLHLGTLAAILFHYRQTGIDGARGLLGATDVSPEYQRNSVIRAGIFACLATLPAIPVGLFLKEPLERAFDSLTAAALGFLVTAFALGLSMWMKGGDKGLARTTWWHALVIGMAQAFAVLPGVSRSGMTITTALALGFTRSWAVGFSLLIAVPAILGASVLELKDLDPSTLTPEFVGPLCLGVLAAGIVGYLAILWLLKVVNAGRMWYFSVYLVGLSLAIFSWILLSGGMTDGPRTVRAHRPALLQPASIDARSGG